MSVTTHAFFLNGLKAADPRHGAGDGFMRTGSADMTKNLSGSFD